MGWRLMVVVWGWNVKLLSIEQGAGLLTCIRFSAGHPFSPPLAAFVLPFKQQINRYDTNAIVNSYSLLFLFFCFFFLCYLLIDMVIEFCMCLCGQGEWYEEALVTYPAEQNYTVLFHYIAWFWNMTHWYKRRPLKLSECTFRTALQ